MNVLSLVWGILSLVGFGVAFIPCLGSLNWLNIPFSSAGLVASIIALSKSPPDQKGPATAGLVMCAIAVVLGAFRLWAGGGVI